MSSTYLAPVLMRCSFRSSIPHPTPPCDVLYLSSPRADEMRIGACNPAVCPIHVSRGLGLIHAFRYYQPAENMIMALWPAGWRLPGYDVAGTVGWHRRSTQSPRGSRRRCRLDLGFILIFIFWIFPVFFSTPWRCGQPPPSPFPSRLPLVSLTLPIAAAKYSLQACKPARALRVRCDQTSC